MTEVDYPFNCCYMTKCVAMKPNDIINLLRLLKFIGNVKSCIMSESVVVWTCRPTALQATRV